MPFDFKPLSITEQNTYKLLLKNTPQKASDYSFVNIWSWQEEYGLKWDFAYNLAWILQTRPATALWAPVGPWHEVDWKAIFQAKHLNQQNFIRVPQELMSIWQNQFSETINFQEDPDQWDYIYSIEELISLKGNRFHKKKNLLKQFLNKYSFSYFPLSTEQIEEALTLQTEWCLWRDCEESTTLQAENKAILKAFHEWSSIEDIMGAGIEIEGKMVAFSIAEPLDEANIVVHFEKACPLYKGIYQAINQLFLKNSAADFTYVNREQDLGDPGLRQAKKSYNPSHYLKKFSVQF